MQKRTILGWLFMGGGVVAVIMGFMFILSVSQQKSEITEFSRKHAEAPRRAAALMPRGNWTTATLAAPSAPPLARAAATTRTGLIEEMASIHNLIQSIRLRRSNNAWVAANIGLGGMTLILPAGEFPEEGTAGPPPVGKALRARVRAEALKVLTDKDIWSARRLRATTATLATQMQPVMDRTRGFLLAGWSPPDFSADDLNRQLGDGFFGAAGLAVLREGLRGQPEQAGRMLERLVLAELTLRIGRFPLQAPLGAAQRSMLALARRGGLDDGALVRTQGLLEKALLTEGQLADLRTAHAMAVERVLGPRPDAQRIAGPGESPLEVFLELTAERSGRAMLLSLLRPMALAWAEGDEREYWARPRSVAGRIFMAPYYGRYYPVDLAPFAPDPLAAANEGVDLTRLIAAAARLRQKTGRDPERLEDLAAELTGPFAAQGKASRWVVDRLAPEGDDRATTAPAPRPIFYCARRVQASSFQLRYAYGNLDTGIFIDKSGMPRESRSRQGQFLLLVRAIWPRPEDLTDAWMEALKAEDRSQESEDGIEK